MIFGRERRVKTTVPAGMFVVEIDDYDDPRYVYEVRQIAGYLVKAESREDANHKARAYMTWLHRTRPTRRRLPR